jgi:hypothetical protein
MTETIKKLPSGFYAIMRGADVWRADLVPWDGKRGTEYPYNVNATECFRYFIDASGTIWCTENSSDRVHIWCGASDLNRHCAHLHRLLNRH